MPRERTQRSMFNPYTALVFLIGQPNECKSNPYCTGHQSIFSSNGGLNPRKACHRKDYFSTTALGAKSQTQRREVSLDTPYLVLFVSRYCRLCTAAVNNVPVAFDLM